VKRFSVWLCVSALVTQSVSAQQFFNLEFESANLPPLAPGEHGDYVSIADAIPGWTCFIDRVQVTQVINNNGTVGGPSLSIWGPDAPDVGGVFQGSYTVILSAGFGGDAGHTTSIAQTGLIPVSARSLLFKAAPYDPGEGSFSVFMGGQNLDYYALSTGPNYTLYGASISSGLAGTVQALTFTDASFAGTWHYEKLDDVQFTSQPIPEPSVLSLVAVVLMLSQLSRSNNRMHTNCRPASPLDAGRRFGRAVHARPCVSGGSRPAR
jgi:hypothetical protein